MVLPLLQAETVANVTKDYGLLSSHAGNGDLCPPNAAHHPPNKLDNMKVTSSRSGAWACWGDGSYPAKVCHLDV
jgi:hypothetical protein